jgi:hypothetical protein
MPMPFDFSQIDIDKLPNEAQKGVLFLALLEEDYIDGDNVLMYSKMPIYAIKMPKNPKEAFTFEQFHKIFFYLLKSDFVFPFSFIDDSINSSGFKPIYFLLSSDFTKIHQKEKDLIQKVNIEKDLGFLYN